MPSKCCGRGLRRGLFGEESLRILLRELHCVCGRSPSSLSVVPTHTVCSSFALLFAFGFSFGSDNAALGSFWARQPAHAASRRRGGSKPIPTRVTLFLHFALLRLASRCCPRSRALSGGAGRGNCGRIGTGQHLAGVPAWRACRAGRARQGLAVVESHGARGRVGPPHGARTDATSPVHALGAGPTAVDRSWTCIAVHCSSG
mmetsp:Transcript_18529/g.53219  ORF Transcript_18529/g.53219 Transcript_18529/m.53219 type:complete len:202 (+) Transcript_18529:355-960(+)